MSSSSSFSSVCGEVSWTEILQSHWLVFCIDGEIGDGLWSLIEIKIPSKRPHFLPMAHRLTWLVGRSKFSNRLTLKLDIFPRDDSPKTSKELSLIKNITLTCLERTDTLCIHDIRDFTDWLPLGLDGSALTKLRSLGIHGPTLALNFQGESTTHGPLFCVPSPSLRFFTLSLAKDLTMPLTAYFLLLKNLAVHAPHLTHININTDANSQASEIFAALALLRDLEFLRWIHPCHTNYRKESPFKPSVSSLKPVTRTFPKLKTLALGGKSVIPLISSHSTHLSLPVFEAPCLTHLHITHWDPSHTLPQFPALTEFTCIFPTKMTQNVFNPILLNSSTLRCATYCTRSGLVPWISNLTSVLRSNIGLLDGPLRSLNLSNNHCQEHTQAQEAEILHHLGSFLIQKKILVEFFFTPRTCDSLTQAQPSSFSLFSSSFILYSHLSPTPPIKNASTLKMGLSSSLLKKLATVQTFVQDNPDVFEEAQFQVDHSMFGPRFWPRGMDGAGSWGDNGW